MALSRVDFKVSLGNGRREFSMFTAVLLWERCQNTYIVYGFSSWKEVSSMCKVYIDDVLIFSESIEHHWKHLHKFLQIVSQNGLVVSAKKIKLFQPNVRFLGFNISQSQIHPIDRVIQFADKFPDQIL
ncbi:unnamed protein product [Prunus brigantina]